MNLLRTVILIIIVVLAPCQLKAGSALLIETTPVGELSLYPWITFISSGPIDWLGENATENISSRTYRVVVITAEIYNRVYIEEITSGSEGCCIKVASTKEIDLEKIYRHFGFIGEIGGFSFVEWKSKTSFEFAIHDKHFILTGANQKFVTVMKL